MVILIIPWLLQLGGCVRPYHPPFGGGKPAVAMVRVVRPKKVKKKKYIVALDSAIIFHVPSLDESSILEEVDEATLLRYTADATAVHGRLGDGDAATPGWADGFMDGEVRFIRLEYDGDDWDDGMDSLTRADRNFLDRFRELSGGMKVARYSESHPTRLLRKYPKGEAPPFVYITGSGRIGMKDRDVRILRNYLLGGGLLFADAGSPQWDASFRSFCERRLFPGNPLLVIADDDPIFQLPFTFPNGSPPLWHHGGRKGLGVKYKGRWVVFYHPGDLNDAWKIGNSGIDPELAESAFQLGVNVVYYSFIQYIEATRKYRK